MTKAQRSTGRGARKGRRKPPVRTPVEGDWLRLHRASRQGYVLVPKDGGGSRREYLGAYYAEDGRSLCRETVEKAARFIREGDAVGVPLAAKRTPTLTVDDLAERFLVNALDEHGPHSNAMISLKTVLSQARSLYGSKPASEFGPLALQAVRAKMIDSGRWNRVTLNAHIRRLQSVFRWAVSNEMIPVTTYQALATVPGLRRARNGQAQHASLREPRKVGPVPEEHVAAVMPRISRQLRALVEFQLATGCRPGEAVLVRPCDLDRTKDVWVYEPETHKNAHRGHRRSIYVGPKAQAALRPFLLRPPTEFCFSPAEAEEERLQTRHERRVTPPDFGNTRGTNRVRHPEKAPGDRYTTQSYRRAVQRACVAANVPGWTPNRLRHSVATELRRLYGIEAARVTLGHSDARITAEVYAERDEELARKIAQEVG